MLRNILVIVPVAILLLFLLFAITIFEIQGKSMEPAIRNGERVWILLFGYSKPKTGDIILFERPDQPALAVKRVAAVERDPITRNENSRLVAGSDIITLVPQPVGVIQLYSRVPPGYYMVLGDNPDASLDSRHFGFVPHSSVRGKVIGKR
ncbi:signal peptidase I [Spirochaeta dissipatitropha]